MMLHLQLAWVFFKIGLFCWGGGLAIIPMVENEVVSKYGWLTKHEFVDAMILGQVSPGPVIISATFIGYKTAGVPGAITATASVILPSFILICMAAKAAKKFQKNRWFISFMSTARIAVIGTIFHAVLSIGRTSISDINTIIILISSLILLKQYQISPLKLLFFVALMGVIL